MTKLTRNDQAFTLIEMVVTIAIISVLALILLLIIDPLAQQKKAKDAKVRQNVRLILAAAHQYYADGTTPLLTTTNNIFTSAFSSTFKNYLYKNEVPTHPCGNAYEFSQVPSGTNLAIKACSLLCSTSISFCISL